jgi:hypothetical protein
MSYTYATFKTALAAALTVDEADDDFTALLPTIIDGAEQFCYRELDLVDASVAVNGYMTPNDRYFTLPTTSGHIIMVDAINVISGTSRYPMKPVSRDVVDFFWPSDTAPSLSSIPSIFARVDDARVLVGPAPGIALLAEVVGTIRPDPLSVSNTTTFLTSYLSDLFFAATMMDSTGVLLKNFGAQSDDPRMAVSWKEIFQARLASARSEELRKNYISANSPLPASAKA